jgi:hypothetical protein
MLICEFERFCVEEMLQKFEQEYENDDNSDWT